MRASVLAGGALLLLAVPLHGQLCAGNATFSGHPFQAEARLDVQDRVETYSAGVAFGASTGPFGMFQLGRAVYDTVQDSGTIIGILGGYAHDLNRQGTVQVCPTVQYISQYGPSIGTAFGKASQWASEYAIGFSFGGLAMTAPTAMLAPFMSAVLVANQSTASLGGNSSTTSTNYGIVTLGVGWIINEVVSIRPSASIPFALAGGETSFNLRLAFAFGR